MIGRSPIWRSDMRTGEECAQAARRLVRAANLEQDLAVRKRLLSLANANRGLVRLARLLAKKSQLSEHKKESMRKVDYEHDLNQGPLILNEPQSDELSAPPSAAFSRETLGAIRAKTEQTWKDTASIVADLKAWRAEI